MVSNVAKLIMTVKEMENRDAWLEMRKKGIGGSDCASALGMNPFKSTFQLWLEKTGQYENPPTSERLYWGTVLEGAIADRFSEIKGKQVRKQGMLQSEEYPWMLADVDRVIVGENAILECKTTSSYLKEGWKDDNLPDNYYLQVQHYMAVGGYDKCYVACLIGGQELVIKEVERNEEDIEAIIKAESDFWNKYVLSGNLPPVDDTTRCEEILKAHFKGGSEAALDLDAEYDDICEDIKKLEDNASEINKMILEKKNKLRLTLGNNEFARTPKYNVWYRSGYVRTSFNTKQFQKDYPDLYDKYKSVSTYRTLKIRESKARKED